MRKNDVMNRRKGINEIKAEMELFKLLYIGLAGAIVAFTYETTKTFVEGDMQMAATLLPADIFVVIIWVIVARQYGACSRQLDELEYIP